MTTEVRDATVDDLPFLSHLLRASAKWVVDAYRKGPTLVTTVSGQLAAALFIGFNVNLSLPQGEILWAYTLPFFRKRKFLRRMWETHLNRTPMARYIAEVPERAVAMQCALREFGFVGKLLTNQLISFRRGINA